MAKLKAIIGGRAKWTGQNRTDYGTILSVSPNGRRVEVKWQIPDPDSGEDTFSYDLDDSASGVRLV